MIESGTNGANIWPHLWPRSASMKMLLQVEPIDMPFSTCTTLPRRVGITFSMKQLSPQNLTGGQLQKSEIIAKFCHAGCDMDGPCLRKQLLSRSKNVKVLLQLDPATSSNTIVEVITSFKFFSEAETREHSSKSKMQG